MHGLGYTGRSDGWKQVHETIRQAIPEESRPDRSWDVGHDLRGVGASLRVRDLINLTYEQHHSKMKSLGEELPSSGYYKCDLYLDVSQDAKRNAVMEGSLRSLCAGSCFYSFRADRSITAAEHLLLCGWSEKAVTDVLAVGMKPSILRDLSGESMAPPCVGLCLTALCLCLGGNVWA